MTNADHDPRELDPAFSKKLRAALDPGLAGGASARIADGAWQRAREAPVAPVARRLPRRAIRYAGAAAVLLAMATGGLVLRPEATAFAVEGEPVSVWKGDNWEPAKLVHGDATVFAPAGTVALLGQNGARIEPTAGAVFRITLTKNAPFEVRVMRGSVAVTGGSHRLVAGDFEMQPQTVTANVTLRAALISGDSLSIEPPVLPPAFLTDAIPQVEAIVGSAFVRHLGTGERRSLAQMDVLTLDADSQKMLPVHRWSHDVATHVFLGAMPVGAAPTPGGDAQLVLHGIDHEMIATLVPHAKMRRVFALMNFATLENLRATPRLTVAVAIHEVSPDDHLEREFVREKDGNVSALRIFGDGRVELESDRRVQIFPSLDAARASSKEALAPFVAYLDDYFDGGAD